MEGTVSLRYDLKEGSRPGYPRTETAEPGGSFGMPVPASGTVSEDRLTISGSHVETADLGAAGVWVTEYEWSIARLD